MRPSLTADFDSRDFDSRGCPISSLLDCVNPQRPARRQIVREGPLAIAGGRCERLQMRRENQPQSPIAPLLRLDSPEGVCLIDGNRGLADFKKLQDLGRERAGITSV